MKHWSLILIIFSLSSCVTDSQAILDENKTLKEENEQLKKIIKENSYNYSFKAIKPKIIAESNQLAQGEKSTLKLFILADKMNRNNRDYQTEFEFSSTLKNDIILKNENGENVLVYMAQNIGHDTVEVHFILKDPNNEESMIFTEKHTFEIK